MITDLTSNVIEKIKFESVPMLEEALGRDLSDVILYGSCARGDFHEDSDVDIALLTKCDRIEAEDYVVVSKAEHIRNISDYDDTDDSGAKEIKLGLFNGMKFLTLAALIH